MSLSLEQELALPKAATLSISHPFSLRTSSGATIQLSSDTSVRPNARCLIVGRQANKADIRIQHGSVSRIHAALYYNQDQNICLQDLGGKQGTFVNGERIQGEKVLFDGDTIIFGNVRENSFSVIGPSVPDETQKDIAETQQLADTKEQVCEDANPPTEEKNPQNTSLSDEMEPVAMLSGRAKREAEIAAMMASLDEVPSYQKFVPASADAENDNLSGRHIVESQDDSMLLIQTYKLPIAQRLDLSSKLERRYVVTCLAIDPAGSRFCVGGTDTNLRLFDFAGMDQQRTTPFKVIQVDDGHIVIGVSYSNTGDRILVGTAGIQPIVLDRDGLEM